MILQLRWTPGPSRLRRLLPSREAAGSPSTYWATGTTSQGSGPNGKTSGKSPLEIGQRRQRGRDPAPPGPVRPTPGYPGRLQTTCVPVSVPCPRFRSCSVDQGIYGHLTLRNLAALAADPGDAAEARRLWQSILEECPGGAEATAKLAG